MRLVPGGRAALPGQRLLGRCVRSGLPGLHAVLVWRRVLGLRTGLGRDDQVLQPERGAVRRIVSGSRARERGHHDLHVLRGGASERGQDVLGPGCGEVREGMPINAHWKAVQELRVREQRPSVLEQDRADVPELRGCVPRGGQKVGREHAVLREDVSWKGLERPVRAVLALLRVFAGSAGLGREEMRPMPQGSTELGLRAQRVHAAMSGGEADLDGGRALGRIRGLRELCGSDGRQ